MSFAEKVYRGAVWGGLAMIALFAVSIWLGP